jgi:hypothetical protein
MNHFDNPETILAAQELIERRTLEPPVPKPRAAAAKAQADRLRVLIGEGPSSAGWQDWRYGLSVVNLQLLKE